MIRKFKFEGEVYKSLNCLPMAARRKLDALGIKIHLTQWELLGRGERLTICHAPIGSDEERYALRTFIVEATIARCGPPPRLRPKIRAGPLIRPRVPWKCWPETHARQVLDEDQRYALIKLGDTEKPSHNFAAALREFFGALAQ